MPLLFAYGTLREPRVQLSVFGRELGATPDALRGFERGQVTIEGTVYPILRPAAGAATEIPGLALEVEPADVAPADAYEGPAYRRIEVALTSGRRAFVYVAAAERSGSSLS
jgi:hypothetical protein